VVVSARTAEEGESRLPGTLGETVERIRAAGGEAMLIKADLAQSAERERLWRRRSPPTARSTPGHNAAITFFTARRRLHPRSASS